MQPNSFPLARRALPAALQLRAVIVLALAALAVLVLLIILGVTRSAPAATAPPAATRSSSVHLTAAQLATLEIRSVETHAFHTEESAEGKIALNADAATPVFSPYSGRVVRVIAALGASVKRGEPLLAIESPELVQAQSDLATARSQFKLATADEERRHQAYETKGASLQDWQHAEADLVAARAALDAARNRLRILGRSAEEIAALETQSTPDPVALVRAPIGGVVTDRQVGPGQYLQAGASTPVYTVGDVSSVWLIAGVREADAPQVERGQAIEVHVLALPGRVYHARLSSVAATVDPTTHRVAVRAVLANSDGKLKPEMFASFDIITSGDSRAPAVPEEAIVREGEAAHVWVLGSDNGLELRRIRTGRMHEGMVEVLEGLRAGERVVTRGSLFIDRAAQPG